MCRPDAAQERRTLRKAASDPPAAVAATAYLKLTKMTWSDGMRAIPPPQVVGAPG